MVRDIFIASCVYICVCVDSSEVKCSLSRINIAVCMYKIDLPEILFDTKCYYLFRYSVVQIVFRASTKNNMLSRIQISMLLR